MSKKIKQIFVDWETYDIGWETLKPLYDCIVAADGTWDHLLLSEAINAWCHDIFIKSWTYNETWTITFKAWNYYIEWAGRWSTVINFVNLTWGTSSLSQWTVAFQVPANTITWLDINNITFNLTFASTSYEYKKFINMYWAWTYWNVNIHNNDIKFTISNTSRVYFVHFPSWQSSTNKSTVCDNKVEMVDTVNVTNFRFSNWSNADDANSRLSQQIFSNNVYYIYWHYNYPRLSFNWENNSYLYSLCDYYASWDTKVPTWIFKLCNWMITQMRWTKWDRGQWILLQDCTWWALAVQYASSSISNLEISAWTIMNVASFDSASSTSISFTSWKYYIMNWYYWRWVYKCITSVTETWSAANSDLTNFIPITDVFLWNCSWMNIDWYNVFAWWDDDTFTSLWCTLNWNYIDCNNLITDFKLNWITSNSIYTDRWNTYVTYNTTFTWNTIHQKTLYYYTWANVIVWNCWSYTMTNLTSPHWTATSQVANNVTSLKTF